MDLRLQLLLIFEASALITIFAALPLSGARFKPNWFYGFRTPPRSRTKRSGST